ncbi:MAG: hypothetical protein KIS67_03485 [Verrucomicrobiae bacterium]|nr:hypothetical protein [Verrucomicrobiae bacterium]
MRITMRTNLVLLLLLALLVMGCHQKAKQDSAQMDAILAAEPVDLVAMTSRQRTNHLRGDNLQLFLAALNPTNRVRAARRTEAAFAHGFVLMSGTNTVLELSSNEHGELRFRDYSFRLKQWPPFTLSHP